MAKEARKESRKGTRKEERIDYCLDWIQRVNNENTILNSDRQEALRYIQADSTIVPYEKDSAGKAIASTVTTADVRDDIESIKPSLLEIFTGNDDVVRLTPKGPEDVTPVENLQILVNDQIRVQNPWFKIFNDWLDDGLSLKVGVVKYQWHREVQFIEKQYGDKKHPLSIEEYNSLVLKVAEEYDELKPEELKLAPDEFVKDVEPIIEKQYGELGIIEERVAGYNTATFIHALISEGPLIEAIPAEDVVFPHKLTREIKDAPFVYHRARYTKQQFIKKFGKDKFTEVEDILVSLADSTPTMDGNANFVTLERFRELGTTFLQDKNSEEYFVYECYYYDPTTNKPTITTLAGQTELSHEENIYGRPPFVPMSPIRVAHRACGLGIWDLMKDTQKARTAIFREIMNNMYYGNKGRTFADITRIDDPEELQDNRFGVIIGVRGDPRQIAMPEVKSPLPDGIYNLLETLNKEKDVHSVISRSFQGVNPNVLNKTWRGQNQQVQQASMRVTMMARVIAEIAITPLVEAVIKLNLQFLTKKQAIRHLNTWVEISPDNIVGKYDVSVNVGLGTGNKAETVAHMQQLLALQGQLLAGGVPIVSPRTFYNTMKELVRAMGHKNTDDFVENPAYVEAVQQLVALLAQTPLIQDPQVAGIVAKLSPSGPPETGNNGKQESAARAGDNAMSNLLGRMVPRQPMNPFAMEPIGGEVGYE